NSLKPLRGAMRKPSADRQDQENCREERDRQRPQQSLLQVVVLPQAAPQQKNASVSAAARDKNGRVLIAVCVGQDIFLEEVRFGVDRNMQGDRHVSENQLSFGIDQRNKIEPTDIPRQAELQRPAQISLAVAGALRRLVDKNCA